MHRDILMALTHLQCIVSGNSLKQGASQDQECDTNGSREGERYQSTNRETHIVHQHRNINSTLTQDNHCKSYCYRGEIFVIK